MSVPTRKNLKAWYNHSASGSNRRTLHSGGLPPSVVWGRGFRRALVATPVHPLPDAGRIRTRRPSGRGSLGTRLRGDRFVSAKLAGSVLYNPCTGRWQAQRAASADGDVAGFAELAAAEGSPSLGTVGWVLAWVIAFIECEAFGRCWRVGRRLWRGLLGRRGLGRGGVGEGWRAHGCSVVMIPDVVSAVDAGGCVGTVVLWGWLLLRCCSQGWWCSTAWLWMSHLTTRRVTLSRRRQSLKPPSHVVGTAPLSVPSVLGPSRDGSIFQFSASHLRLRQISRGLCLEVVQPAGTWRIYVIVPWSRRRAAHGLDTMQLPCFRYRSCWAPDELKQGVGSAT